MQITSWWGFLFIYLLLILTQEYLFIDFIKRGREKREKNINVRGKHGLAAFHTRPNRGPNTGNLNMWPDQEWNPQPFSAQNDAPTNRATSAWALLGFFTFSVIKLQ